MLATGNVLSVKQPVTRCPQQTFSVSQGEGKYVSSRTTYFAAGLFVLVTLSTNAIAQQSLSSHLVVLDAPADAATQAVTVQPPSTQASPSTGMPNQPNTPGVTGDWLGCRSKLADQGFTVASGVYYDYSKNLQGGISTSRDANREFFDLDITFTTDKTLGWSGGTFFFNLLDHEGTNGTTRLVGDVQGFDNQDGPTGIQIYQLYYQQMLLDNQLRFKVGRIDSTTDFAYVVNSSAFLGSTFGYSPAITSFPTYPDPAVGAALFWTPNDAFYASGAVADANRSARIGIVSGEPYSVRQTSGGVFAIVELGTKWTFGKDKLAGRFAVGGYHHTGEFLRFDNKNQDGTSGMYAVFDQTLWQSSPPGESAPSPTGLGIFAQYGLADANVNPINQHIGEGFQWTGPIPFQSRSADVFGIGTSFVRLSNQARFAKDYELAIEGFYKIQLTPWLNIQPDLQFILNPGGTDHRDAVVATTRVELDF